MAGGLISTTNVWYMMTKRTSSRRKTNSTRQPSKRESPSVGQWFLQREIWGLIITAIGVITLIALAARSSGKLSEAWSLMLRQAFGVGALPVALLLIAGGILLLLWSSLKGRFSLRWQAIVGWELIFFSGLGLFHVTAKGSPLALAKAGERGGYIGWALWQITVPLVGKTISAILLFALQLVGVYLVLGIPWHLLSWRIKWVWARIGLRIRTSIAVGHLRADPAMTEPRPRPTKKRAKRPARARASNTRALSDTKASGTKKAKPTRQSRSKTGRTLQGAPPLDLLISDKSATGDDGDARQSAQVIEETLDAFGIPARVVGWNRGPVVTQFGVEPGYIERRDREGNTHRYKIRISKILSLSNDLALALAATSIRIEAPVPGRSVVGIEVPNAEKSLVGLRGVLESRQFGKIRSNLRIALGRDVSGEAVVADLAAMPHLLVAGATGSGKSVCLNAAIVSLLYQNTPDELKLLLIDPKRVELAKYNGVPHLLAPVVIDVERVIVALRWMMREMERRYKQFSQAGARDLKAYNKGAKAKGQDILPMIVVVIDELADLMLMAPDDMERTICRLAQMARATGIHLVIATQRPRSTLSLASSRPTFPRGSALRSHLRSIRALSWIHPALKSCWDGGICSLCHPIHPNCGASRDVSYRIRRSRR